MASTRVVNSGEHAGDVVDLVKNYDICNWQRLRTSSLSAATLTPGWPGSGE